MPEKPTVELVLNCPMVENVNNPGELPYNAPTVGVFLVSMLGQLWKERHLFDGKRPYGDSSWNLDVYASLGKAGLIECTFDEDGYIETVNDELADELVAEAIASLIPQSAK